METNKQSHPHLLLQDGELLIKTELIEDLIGEFCKQTKCNSFDKAYIKIRRQSKTRIMISPSYYPEVFSAPMNLVMQWAKSVSCKSVPGLSSNFDLEKGRYEGGFKVWESTRDLVEFISHDSNLMTSLNQESGTFRALELGAGAALPSLALLSRLFEDTAVSSRYRIHVQDFNWEVLASLTIMNFALNLPYDYLKALLETQTLRLFHGDWKDFRGKSNYKYDLILMSEVIYDSDNFDSLHNLLTKHLRSSGRVVIATKDTYFGLTGGLYPWIEYINSKGCLEVLKIHKVKQVNIPRSLLVLGWPSCK